VTTTSTEEALIETEEAISTDSPSAEEPKEDYGSLLDKLAGDEDDDLPPLVKAKPAPSAADQATPKSSGSDAAVATVSEDSATAELTESASESEAHVQVSCPAGAPKPKINLASMQKAKAKAESAEESMNRLFSGEAPPPAPKNDDEAGARPTAADSDSFDEIPPAHLFREEKPLPAVLVWLDGVSGRVAKVHKVLPPAMGWVGVLLLANASVILLFATLGWI
jgi:hypothetical protein